MSSVTQPIYPKFSTLIDRVINENIYELYRDPSPELSTIELFLSALIHRLITTVECYSHSLKYRNWIHLESMSKQIKAWCNKIFDIYLKSDELPLLHYLISNKNVSDIQSYLYKINNNLSTSSNIIEKWECAQRNLSSPELKIFYLSDFIIKNLKSSGIDYINKGIDAKICQIFMTLIDCYKLNQKIINLTVLHNDALLLILTHLFTEANLYELKYIWTRKKYWQRLEKIFKKNSYLGNGYNPLKDFISEDVIQMCFVSQHYAQKGDLTVCKKLKKYFMDKTRFAIMINIMKLRQCNYKKCRRKDLKKFKVCKRCKSSFYCDKRHQKLDWIDHKKFCVDMKSRNYDIWTNYYKYIRTYDTNYL